MDSYNIHTYVPIVIVLLSKELLGQSVPSGAVLGLADTPLAVMFDPCHRPVGRQ